MSAEEEWIKWFVACNLRGGSCFLSSSVIKHLTNGKECAKGCLLHTSASPAWEKADTCSSTSQVVSLTRLQTSALCDEWASHIRYPRPANVYAVLAAGQEPPVALLPFSNETFFWEQTQTRWCKHSVLEAASRASEPGRTRRENLEKTGGNLENNGKDLFSWLRQCTILLLLPHVSFPLARSDTLPA